MTPRPFPSACRELGCRIDAYHDDLRMAWMLTHHGEPRGEFECPDFAAVDHDRHAQEVMDAWGAFLHGGAALEAPASREAV